MTDPHNIVKIDLDTITVFQKKIHTTKNEDEEIESRFVYNFRKTTWSTHLPVKLKMQNSDDKLVYIADNRFHYLLYTCMRQKLPQVNVHESYKNRIEICWPVNLGLNIIKNSDLSFDDDIFQSIDNIWLNIHSQCYMLDGSGKRDHFNLMIGNVPFLQKWSTFLPEYTLDIPQPWYYCKNEVFAIPLFLCSLSKIEHSYTVISKLSDLLRMRIKNDDGSYLYIKCNTKYLYNLDINSSLPTPELWGRYAQITEEEKNWRKEQKNKLYIEDVISCTSENEYGFGQKATVDLHANTPCKAIFWVAENLKSSSLNNYSNFTTNNNDLFNGWNPILTSNLKYGGIERLPEMDSDHFDRIEMFYKFPSAPWQPGYNAYSFSYDTNSLNADVGITFQPPSHNDLKAKLIVKLGNNDPFLKNIDYSKDSTKQSENINLIPDEIISDNKNNNIIDKNFKIHIRLLVMKKIKFSNNKCFIVSIPISK